MKKSKPSSRLRNLIILAAFLGVLVIAFAFFTSMKTSAHITQRLSLSFTAFDKQKIMDLVDKDKDGDSDCCELSVEEFITQEGLIEIPLPNGQKMGPLDKTKKVYHTHADLNVYMNGKKINLGVPHYFVKSAFVHVEQDSRPGTGDVLHIHAPGVPLWWFFESLGMNFTDTCFTLDTQEEYCTQGRSQLQMFVNGKEEFSYGHYVLRDGDRILLTFTDNQQELARQLSSLTDYARLYMPGGAS